VVYEPNCGFCHGNDARGGAAGPDLARSLVVIGDTGGRELGEFLAVGQPGRGMPAFPNLTQAQIADIAVFLHERVEAARNRTPKDVMASVVGDPKAGAVYFNGRGRCSTCHSVNGDLAGIGRKYDPMALQDRFVNPRPGGQRGQAAPASPRSTRTVTVTLPSGEAISGTLNFVSEFAVTLIDAAGRRRSFARSGDAPKVVIVDPLQAHLDLMRSYTDKDMHDLTAYLVTIR
jgi:mono/diheme cytochrome c family protein